MTTTPLARNLLRLSAVLLASMAAACAVAAAAAPEVKPATVIPAAPQKLPVWEHSLKNFSDADYAQAVEELFQDFESRTGRRLAPGAHKKAGLKVYTDSGPGLATPYGLVRAVIAALERRGFKTESIFLVGLNQLRMRLTGYLPSLSTGISRFPGHPTYVLESGRYYDPQWFYDSPLPSRFDPVANERAAEVAAKGKANTTLEEDRKSFLATPLFLDADFWINLPVYSDHPVLGVNGALVSATLWNASNTFRFFRSPATAPAAVAEMAAIPELREGWVLTLSSLECYQYIGGPYFNSLYSVSEPRLWMSGDPVLLDALMLDRLNRWRKLNGFESISDDDARLLNFAQQLGVGRDDVTDVQWFRLGDPLPASPDRLPPSDKKSAN